MRYRPVEDIDKKDDDERDLYDAIVDACDELARQGPGDILVFLPGEREIREAAKLTQACHPTGFAARTRDPAAVSRLSAGSRTASSNLPAAGGAIVLATNVAETSLTVPGIRYVVDTGWPGSSAIRTATRSSSCRSRRFRRPRQPAGRRCGRVAAGVCIRLYDEAGFQGARRRSPTRKSCALARWPASSCA